MTTFDFKRIWDTPDTLTENLSPAHSTTGERVLDAYSKLGAMRHADFDRLVGCIRPAWRENPKLAARLLFWLRDCTSGNGAGERDTFLRLYTWLADFSESGRRTAVVNLPLVAKYGRWKDVVELMVASDALRDACLYLISRQYTEDIVRLRADGEDAMVSLLAKWMPSEKTGERQAYIMLRDHLYNGLRAKDRQYRKDTVALRKQIGLIEHALSQGSDSVEFGSVPAGAAFKYRKAFSQRWPEQYAEFTSKVESGHADVRVTGFQPYKAVAVNGAKDGVQPQWTSLVRDLRNTLEELGVSFVPMADVSGSMQSSYHSNITPMDVSVSLSILLAQANPTALNGLCISFTDRTNFYDVSGMDLDKAVKTVVKYVGYSTNFAGALREVLARSVRLGLSQDDLPDYIVAISDMEFDHPDIGGNKTPYQVIQQEYAEHGLRAPKILFWNVDAKSNQHPVRALDGNALLVSGWSADVFKSIMRADLDNLDPYSVMVKVLENYNDVRVI